MVNENIKITLQKLVEVKDIRRNLLIVCPFHSDSNPSCSVKKDTGVFQCFSCGETGNFFKLLAKLENVSEEVIKQRYEKDFSASVLAKDLLNEIVNKKRNEKAASFNFKHLKSSILNNRFPKLSELSYNYLTHSRKLNNKIIELFNLREGVEFKKNNKLNKKWVNRIIIPFYNLENKIVGFGGRAINKDLKPKVKKYIVQEGMGKSFLFGLNNLWKGKKLKYLILGESDIDTMYLQQLGYNAVAGWAVSSLSPYQVFLITNVTEVLILNYNNRLIDEAGAKATIREEEKMKNYLPTLILDYPNDVKDANEMTVKEVNMLYGNFLKRYKL